VRSWILPLLAGALAVGCSSRVAPGEASGPVAARVVDAASPPAAPLPAPVPTYDDLEPAPADDRPDAGTVKIKLVAEARREAHVFWGRQDLGVAPVELVRPRGSAPLDLTIQAPGCLPLHTRAFTDRDDTLSLRLYSERDASGLPGYSAGAVPPTGPTKTRRQF
jgi:hypothetical protein